MAANPQPAPELVRCLECGEELWVMTASHARADGFRDMQEFKARHPDQTICGSLFLKAQKRAHALRVGKPRRSVRFQGHYPVDDWAVLCMVADGHRFVDIGKQLDRHPAAIWYVVHRLGIERRPTSRAPVYDLGQPFDTSALRSLKQISGLSIAEFAEQLNCTFDQLASTLQLKRKLGLVPQTARTALVWRAGIINYLLAPPRQEDRVSKYGAGSIFHSFFPGLKERFLLLGRVLHACHTFLTHQPTAGNRELQQYLCDQARLETAGRIEGNLFRSFLPWAPQLMQSLEANLNRIREGGRHADNPRDRRTSRVAARVLADTLGTTIDVIRFVVEARKANKVRPIPPTELRLLILSRGAKWSARVTAAQSEVERLTQELAQAKTERAKAKASRREVGRTREDEVWTMADDLYNEGLKWEAIKERVDKAFHFSRSIKAYQEGRKRHLERQKPTK